VVVDPLELSLEAMKDAAVAEAIVRLGLVATDAAPTIRELLDDETGAHPRKLCSEYRKRGQQVPDMEKAALGIRKNSFLSLDALNELTESGRGDPLTAHETVLLRATFSVSRYRTIHSYRGAVANGTIKAGALSFEYEMLRCDCPSCAAMDGKKVKAEKAAIFAPATCICDTANYAILGRVDWFYDVG